MHSCKSHRRVSHRRDLTGCVSYRPASHGPGALLGIGISNDMCVFEATRYQEVETGGMLMAVMPSPPRNPPIRPRWARDSISLSSVQSLYVVELKLSLRTRLARQIHARCIPSSVEKSIASLAPRFC